MKGLQLGKGGSNFSKTETILPWEVQKTLNQILSTNEGLCDTLQKPPALREENSPESEVFKRLLSDSAGDFNESNGIAANATPYVAGMRSAVISDIIEKNPGLKPNFGQLIDHYPVTLTYPNPQGACHALVYHSTEQGDQALSYTFHCRKPTDGGELEVRLANVEPRAAELTSFGLKKVNYAYDNTGFLEYKERGMCGHIPDEFKGAELSDSPYLSVKGDFPGDERLNTPAKAAIVPIIGPILNGLSAAPRPAAIRRMAPPASPQNVPAPPLVGIEEQMQLSRELINATLDQARQQNYGIRPHLLHSDKCLYPPVAQQAFMALKARQAASAEDLAQQQGAITRDLGSARAALKLQNSLQAPGSKPTEYKLCPEYKKTMTGSAAEATRWDRIKQSTIRKT